MSPDPRQALCYQCHAPLANTQVHSGDDRTPVGVHEGFSCLACHDQPQAVHARLLRRLPPAPLQLRPRRREDGYDLLQQAERPQHSFHEMFGLPSQGHSAETREAFQLGRLTAPAQTNSTAATCATSKTRGLTSLSWAHSTLSVHTLCSLRRVDRAVPALAQFTASAEAAPVKNVLAALLPAGTKQPAQAQHARSDEQPGGRFGSSSVQRRIGGNPGSVLATALSRGRFRL